MSRLAIGEISTVHRLENDRGYRQGIGYTINFRYRGSETSCGTQLNALVAAGGVVDANITPDSGGMFNLTVSYAANSATDPGGSPIGSESVVTTWTRESASIEKSMWNLGPIRDALSILVQEDRVAFRATLEKFWTGQITKAQWNTFYSFYEALPEATDQMKSDIKNMMDAYAAGSEAIREETFQIVRTQVGPPENLINNDARIGLVLKRSTLISDSTMPEAFKSVVPGADIDGFYWQSAAQISVIDSNRWQVVSRWEYIRAFNTWIFGAAI